MLSLEERRQLMKILLEEDTSTTNIDVSNRSRDEKGRFLPEPKKAVSRSQSVRPIKLKKIKGSYNSYLVKTRWLSTKDKVYLWLFISFVALAIAI
jgi:hypothetical protein